VDFPARVESPHTVRTQRLLLRPVGPEHLDDLVALKADEAAFGIMLGGTRTPEQTDAELRADIAFWQARGYGTWAVHEGVEDAFIGIVGLMQRPDGRGVALRFALWPQVRGRGYAREAAKAALEFGHAAGLSRIVAIARETNTASRAVLGDLGMVLAERYDHEGHAMLMFESLRPA